MKIIRSSDVGRYLYCPVCWWTEEKEGVKITPAVLEGGKAHKTISRNTATARILYVCITLVLALIFLLSTYVVIS